MISSHDSRSQPRRQLGPALAVAVEKRFVVRAHLDDPLGDAGEQRQVAADVRLHVQAGDLRCRTAGSATSLGTLKSHQARFDDRVDDDHLARRGGGRASACASAADDCWPGCRR